MVKNNDVQFFMEDLRMKRKYKKKYFLEQGFEPQIFRYFPPMI